MIVKIWVDESDEGREATIFVRTAATQAPSAANPYGQFRLDFCGRESGGDRCLMNGFLEGAAAGMSYYQLENEMREGEELLNTVALRMTSSGATSGSGRMRIEREDAEDTFAFAYNADLFRRSAGNDDQCFSRDASDPDTGLSVWRYGLYDTESGARITRYSGFPIEYATNGSTYHGYLGYWGLSLPREAMSTIANGDTVQKVDYSSGQSPTRTSYTVVRAGGKLTRHTKRARTLRDIERIRFTTFVGDDAELFPGALPFTQYEMYWDDAAGDFKVTGQMGCSANGCFTMAFDSEISVSPAYWSSRGGVQGWSQALGGEVFINLGGASGAVDAAAIVVTYRTQDLVYPSELPATLYCVRDCPTAAAMDEFFVQHASGSLPFAVGTFNNWRPTAVEGIVSYTSDAVSAVLLDGSGQPVTLTDAELFNSQSEFRWGLRTGRLFTSLADAECESGSATYCDWKANDLEVYYQWETGPESWNQFAAVRNGAGEFVTFDPPLQVTYQVPAGAAYGPYGGKSIVLQYGGFGDLWGIPGSCVSRLTNETVSCETEDARYVPSFVIPLDAASGRVTTADTAYLVKWLDREIRFAGKDPSVCAAAGLELPSGITLPTAADLLDPSDPGSSIYIGTQPTVTDPPRVIHGEVKY